MTMVGERRASTSRPAAGRGPTGRGGGVRRWLPLLLAIALVVVVAAAVWVVFFSRALVVHEVEIRGTTATLSQRTVASAVGPVEGQRLARVDGGGIRARVSAIPAVAGAQVQRHWPDTLVITVTERQPVLAVTQAGRSGVQAVDATGVAFRQLASRPAGLPAAYVSGPRPQESVAELVRITVALRGSPALRARVVSITATSPDAITLNLDHNVKVFLGSSDSLAQKLQVLVPLMKQKSVVYDVSAPDLPVTRSH